MGWVFHDTVMFGSALEEELAINAEQYLHSPGRLSIYTIKCNV
jgi:hypothetical protein